MGRDATVPSGILDSLDPSLAEDDEALSSACRVAMLGWLREASSASRSKRASRSGSRVKSSGSTFSAT